MKGLWSNRTTLDVGWDTQPTWYARVDSRNPGIWRLSLVQSHDSGGASSQRIYNFVSLLAAHLLISRVVAKQPWWPSHKKKGCSEVLKRNVFRCCTRIHVEWLHRSPFKHVKSHLRKRYGTNLIGSTSSLCFVSERGTCTNENDRKGLILK